MVEHHKKKKKKKAHKVKRRGGSKAEKATRQFLFGTPGSTNFEKGNWIFGSDVGMLHQKIAALQDELVTASEWEARARKNANDAAEKGLFQAMNERNIKELARDEKLLKAQAKALENKTVQIEKEENEREKLYQEKAAIARKNADLETEVSNWKYENEEQEKIYKDRIARTDELYKVMYAQKNQAETKLKETIEQGVRLFYDNATLRQNKEELLRLAKSQQEKIRVLGEAEPIVTDPIPPRSVVDAATSPNPSLRSAGIVAPPFETGSMETSPVDASPHPNGQAGLEPVRAVPRPVAVKTKKTPSLKHKRERPAHERHVLPHVDGQAGLSSNNELVVRPSDALVVREPAEKRRYSDVQSPRGPRKHSRKDIGDESAMIVYENARKHTYADKHPPREGRKHRRKGP